jgi:hypothetical protein
VTSSWYYWWAISFKQILRICMINTRKIFSHSCLAKLHYFSSSFF